MLIADTVHVWRNADGEYHIEWRASRPDTQVVVEPLAGGGQLEAHYTEESAGRARFSGLSTRARQFFQLRDHHGNSVLAAERRLLMEGTPNFRDFGGYRTADGRAVKWGFLFRSGQLSNLSDRDVDLLATLDLDLVCDFRRLEEQAHEPSRLPGTAAPRIASLPIIPGSNARFLEEAENHLGDRSAMFDFMVDINRDFAEGQTEAYATMFREILELEDARFLVHCAAGKDRTGFAAALMLLALGVPEDIVMQDYLLTGRYFRPERELKRLQKKYRMESMDGAAVRPMLEVHRDYLQRALTAIADNHGSVEHYLSEALGVGSVELEELHRRYLD